VPKVDTCAAFRMFLVSNPSEMARTVYGNVKVDTILPNHSGTVVLGSRSFSDYTQKCVVMENLFEIRGSPNTYDTSISADLWI
jgi:hypothetical protein